MADMITQQDSIRLYIIPAWHKKGIVHKEGEPITMFHLQQEFGYPVVLEQLYTNRMEPTSTYATIRTIYNPDGSERERIILGDKLSASYQVLQNSALINSVKPLIEQGCIISTGGTLNQGRRVWVLLELPGDLRVNNGEHIKRYVLVSNDHTGMETARVGFTSIRVLCANTMAIAENARDSQLIKIRHEGNIELSIKNVVKLIDTANQQFLCYGEHVDQLIAGGVDQATFDQYVKTVLFPKFKSESDLPADATSEEKEAARKEADKLLKLQNQINEIFQTEKSIVDVPGANGTVWGAYQAVNFYLNHVQAIGEDRRLHNIGFGTARQTDQRALGQALQLVHAR